MRVRVVGAGPAGLYLAILLRKANPDHEVTVLERNAPNATFGWGVVFSEETLGALREADYPTYLEITDSFARWSTVDIRYRGTLLRSRGHSFSAIKRTHLLDILQRRAVELGADLRFGVEVEPVTAAADVDLLVAADGANSAFRRALAAELGTSVRTQGGKYVWFGTDLVLDAFTFIFRDTEHGQIQVHSYPFDENTSTFIVECTEPTWRALGLDTMTEQQSIEFCQRVFAEDLAGHRLLSNRSVWLDFPLVTNSSWHHGNVVLLGDAAHTAHFSIGSGTKLAMEDSIALVNALTAHPNQVPAALVEFELERQPVVDRFQQAAADSADYFQRVHRYTHLDPIQFAANLLTRSGRVSHANLMQRDPDFVRVLDTWFSGAPGSTTTPWRGPSPAADASTGVPGGIAPPPMFAPLYAGGQVLRNRIVRTADPSDVDAMVLAARGGAGLVLTGLVAATTDGRTTPDCPTLHEDDTTAWLAAAVDKVHAEGARLGLRLGHAGPRAAVRHSAAAADIPLREGGWPLLAASAVRYGPFGPVPKAADVADLDRVCAAFTEAAGRAADAGADVLELDLAHGYLLASLLSPLTNRRTDEFGGTRENRLRFPLRVLAEVRDTWPADRLLAVRITVTDWVAGGLTVEDGIAHARALAEGGAELVHVVAGQSVPETAPEYRRGYLTTLSDRVRNEAGVPTMVGGYLTTTDQVNTIVAAGRADLCVIDPPRTELERTVLGS